MITIGKSLSLTNNRPSGFDYMRLILATAVLCSHTINVCYGQAYTNAIWASPLRGPLGIILPLFFALSGFLVAGSLQRCNTLVSFVGLRIIRLVPALAVDTAVGALLLGPFFTTASWSEYFTSQAFYSYFLNIVGKVHYFLPGVFLENPWGPAINQQLWTLPYELRCYVLLSAIAFVSLVRNRYLFLIVSLTISLVSLAYQGLYLQSYNANTVTGFPLVECFLFGVAAYLFRDRLVWNTSLFVFCLTMTLMCLEYPFGDYIMPLPATYVTVYLGVLDPRRLKGILSGDYSYGIFLYGFAIQQSVAALLGPIGQKWYVNLSIALPLTVALATFSWWCVEKPALKMRLLLYALETRFTNFATAIPLGTYFVQPATGPRVRRSLGSESN